MVRIVDVTLREGNKVAAVVAVSAKTDVTTNMKIGDDELMLGSICYTPDLDIAVCNADGTWTWN